MIEKFFQTFAIPMVTPFRPLPEGGLFEICTCVKFLGFLGFSTFSVPGSSGEAVTPLIKMHKLHNCAIPLSSFAIVNCLAYDSLA